MRHFWTHLFLGLLLLTSFIGCGKNDVEKRESTINEALYLIGEGLCSDALTILTDDGDAYHDPEWVKVKASAEACIAGYSTTVLFGDIPSMGTTTTTFLNSLTLFTNASMTSPSDAEFEALLESVTTLSKAGPVEIRTASNREPLIGTIPGNDINFYLTFTTMLALGRYFNYYGNVNHLGAQGQGGGVNNCLYDYTQDDAVAALGGGSGGNCTAAYVGHPDLESANPIATRAARMCQGVVLFNQFIDAFSNISIPTGEDELTSLSAVIEPAVSAVCSAYGDELVVLCKTFSVATCIANHSTAAAGTAARNNFNTLEMYFGLVFESLFQ